MSPFDDFASIGWAVVYASLSLEVCFLFLQLKQRCLNSFRFFFLPLARCIIKLVAYCLSLFFCRLSDYGGPYIFCATLYIARACGERTPNGVSVDRFGHCLPYVILLLEEGSNLNCSSPAYCSLSCVVSEMIFSLTQRGILMETCHVILT